MTMLFCFCCFIYCALLCSMSKRLLYLFPCGLIAIGRAR